MGAAYACPVAGIRVSASQSARIRCHTRVSGGPERASVRDPDGGIRASGAFPARIRGLTRAYPGARTGR
eukprot:2971673-Rhodomonas_salina.1